VEGVTEPRQVPLEALAGFASWVATDRGTAMATLRAACWTNRDLELKLLLDRAEQGTGGTVVNGPRQELRRDAPALSVRDLAKLPARRREPRVTTAPRPAA